MIDAGYVVGQINQNHATAIGVPTPRDSTHSPSVTGHFVAEQSMRLFDEARTVPANCQPSTTTSDVGDRLVCTIDATKIQNRWLRAFIPERGGHGKEYPRGVVNYMKRILRSYASMIINDSGVPPIIHAIQLSGDLTRRPLTDCLNLLRLCDSSRIGGHELAIELITRETKKLAETYHTFDGPGLLAAFQAHLLYTVTLAFHFAQTRDDSLQLAVISLQEIACATASQGVSTMNESRQSRPNWRLWVCAEATRRTIYTMYMLDNLLCIRERLPLFLGTEIQGLAAPAGSALWKAASEREWQLEYNQHLAKWQAPGLTIDELWPPPPSSTVEQIEQRSARVDKWLECADEFGTMLSAVTICTHEG